MPYRPIRTSFWSDPYILDLERDEKLLYMYLLTNDATTQCGIYEIPLRRVEFETGFSGERIYEMFHKFQADNKIRYSMETREIAIINWRKYNDNPSPKTMAKVAEELENVKNPMLVLLLYTPSEPLLDKTYQKSGDRIIIKNPWESYFLTHPALPKPPDSPNMPHRRGMHTVSIPHPTDSDSDSKQTQTQNKEREEAPALWKGDARLSKDTWRAFEKRHNAFIPDRSKEVDAINKLIHMATKSGDPETVLIGMMKKLLELKETDDSKKGFWRNKPFLPSTLVSHWALVWEEAKMDAVEDIETEEVTF